MRELYKQIFYKDKGTKLTDSAFMTRITVSFLIILASLFAMAFSAYGFFSVGAPTVKNTITSAHYDLKISATKKRTGETTMLSGNTVTAAAGEEYIFSLAYNKTDETATTGFCRVEVLKDGESEPTVYHTVQLGADENAPGGKRESYSFSVKFNENATVSLIAHWGTSKNYSYNNENNEFYLTEANARFEVGTPSANSQGEETEAENSAAQNSEQTQQKENQQSEQETSKQENESVENSNETSSQMAQTEQENLSSGSIAVTEKE